MKTTKQTQRQKRPDKSYRSGLSLIQLARLFPDEESARKWFEEQRWPNGPICPHCEADTIAAIPTAKPMLYRCKACRKHFSVRTGTAAMSA